MYLYYSVKSLTNSYNLITDLVLLSTVERTRIGEKVENVLSQEVGRTFSSSDLLALTRCVCVCVCVYVCVGMCVCMSVYMCVYMCVYTYFANGFIKLKFEYLTIN